MKGLDYSKKNCDASPIGNHIRNTIQKTNKRTRNGDHIEISKGWEEGKRTVRIVQRRKYFPTRGKEKQNNDMKAGAQRQKKEISREMKIKNRKEVE